ncbi:MAG: rSAM/selenodomain-associated transferase 1 [Planctomycetota bacterium]
MQRSTTLFTKRPLPGVAKTRLSPVLEPEQAALLAQAMLLDRAESLGSLEELGPSLAFADPSDAAWFIEALPWIPKQAAQVGAELGERLANHFRATLESGEFGSAVVIGSDQPLVPLARFEEAHRLLEDGADLVLGPDQGGGYYLVGLRAGRPDLFLDIPMSSAGMFDRTVIAGRQQGLRVELLEAEIDVDTGEDLRLLVQHINSNPGRAKELAPRTVDAMVDLRARLLGSQTEA